MMAGLYIPGDSLLHRLGAGIKLLALFVLGVGLVAVDGVIASAGLAVVVASLFTLAAGLGIVQLWQATRPLIIWFVFIGVAQWLVNDVAAALTTISKLAALVWAASLITFTTRLSAMTDCLVALCGWLKPVGVSPQRVAFLIALTVRLIPALADIAREVREAQRARGLERSVLSAVAPVLTRVLKQADAMAESLQARGYEHWDRTS